MSISMFVLYTLAFIAGVFILIVICAVIGAYLSFRYDILDYVKANNIDDTNNISGISKWESGL